MAEYPINREILKDLYLKFQEFSLIEGMKFWHMLQTDEP